MPVQACFLIEYLLCFRMSVFIAHLHTSGNYSPPMLVKCNPALAVVKRRCQFWLRSSQTPTMENTERVEYIQKYYHASVKGTQRNVFFFKT